MARYKQKGFPMLRRVLSINHNDLDGVAAAVAVKYAHPMDHVTTKFGGVDEINNMLFSGLTNQKTPYDTIVLADCSFVCPGRSEYATLDLKYMATYNLPKAIQEFIKRGGELIVLDHHATALDIKKIYAKELSPFSILEVTDANGDKRAGSELAARYNRARRANSEGFNSVIDVFGRLTGDFDVWRDPMGFGGMMSIGMELMNDNFTAFTEMMQAVQFVFRVTPAGAEPTYEAFELAFVGTHLGHYVDLARNMLASETTKALGTAVNHGPRLTEIYTDFFPSLISQSVYERNGGVVIVRYVKDRTKAMKVSLRRHSKCNIDLGKIAQDMGGGGHAESAGITLSPKYTLQDVIEAVQSELVATPIV